MSPFSLGDKFANWASAVLDCPQELELSLVHDAMAGHTLFSLRLC